MPIQSVSARDASPGVAATSSVGANAAVGSSGNARAAPPPPPDVGPATKVKISDEARARLRAAGAEPADIATTNLKDSGAVYAAIRKARAAHSAPRHHAAEAAAPAAGATTAAKA